MNNNLNIILSILFIMYFNEKLKRKIGAKNKDYTNRQGTWVSKIRLHAWLFFVFFFKIRRDIIYLFVKSK